MTETLHEQPPSPPPPPADTRRLVRDPDERVVAGVCAAFGRYTDTDPVLWRVTIAVLTLFGGAGLALYLLGWLLVPRAGQAQSAVERLLRRPDVSIPGVVVLVLGAVVLLGLLDDGPGLGALLVVGGIVYLVSRERRDASAGPRPLVVPPLHGPPPGEPDGSDPAGSWTPSPPAPPRERSPLTALTLSAAALVTGLLLTLGAAGVEGVTAPRVLAAAVLVVGTGLLVGTWYGRGRWLLAVGALLVVLTAGAAGAQHTDLDEGVGERTWTAQDGRTYALGIGEATLDLRTLRRVPDADVTATVAVGRLVVLVPEDLTVEVRAAVDEGSVALVGLDRMSTYLTTPEDGGAREPFVVGDGDVSAVVQLDVRLGEVEVRRVAA